MIASYLRLSHARSAARILSLTVILTLQFATGTAAQIPSPEAFFGFRMGADGELAAWPDIERYFRLVADRSDRVDLMDLGPTTEGRRMIAALVSAPANLKAIEAIKQANSRLADPRTLSEADAFELAARQPVILAIGAGIHSSEVGGTQAATEFLHEAATSSDERAEHTLRNVVLLLIPSLNPDGHVLVTDWHERTKGTRFQGSPMPWLYHKYVGHDINRDAFMLNMVENQNLARLFSSSWHPHVFLTMHQMGTRGPRYFVPPNYEPIDPNYDPLIWRQAGLLGHAMALRLERENRAGVVSNALFDYYWPGYEDSAPLGHNTICLLTEVASARGAFPIDVPPADLTGSPRGLPEYRPQINFPNPWPGGTWRLRDIVDYNLDAMRGLIDGVARYRGDLVRNFYAMGRRAIDRGRTEAPFAFLVPAGQFDPNAAARLLNLLIDSGVEVHEAQARLVVGLQSYPAGTRVILMTQPYRAYVKTLLERQSYPIRRLAPGAPPERPYDVTGWTLPLQMGVEVVQVDVPFEVPALIRLERADVPPGRLAGDRRPTYYVLEAPGTSGVLAANRLHAAGLRLMWTTKKTETSDSRFAPGSLVVRHSSEALAVVKRLTHDLGLEAAGVRGPVTDSIRPVGRPRVGLYRPWVANIDEGWTRWILERYEFPFRTVTDADVRRGRLREELDLVILPDIAPDQIIAGHRAGTVPAEFSGGLGTAGGVALAAFVRDGGTLVSLDSSTAYAVELLELPVRDVVAGAKAEEFLAPGTIVGLDVDTAHPLGVGLASRTAAFFADSAAFEVSSPALPTGHAGAAPESELEIVARYATDDVRLSGWLEGGDRMAGRAAVVSARVGRGRAILIGFRAQHRAQSLATFRLLFNTILTHLPYQR